MMKLEEYEQIAALCHLNGSQRKVWARIAFWNQTHSKYVLPRKELCKQVFLPLSTVSRAIHNLVEFGFLVQEGKQYHIPSYMLNEDGTDNDAEYYDRLKWKQNVSKWEKNSQNDTELKERSKENKNNIKKDKERDKENSLESLYPSDFVEFFKKFTSTSEPRMKIFARATYKRWEKLEPDWKVLAIKHADNHAADRYPYFWLKDEEFRYCEDAEKRGAPAEKVHWFTHAEEAAAVDAGRKDICVCKKPGGEGAGTVTIEDAKRFHLEIIRNW